MTDILAFSFCHPENTSLAIRGDIDKDFFETSGLQPGYSRVCSCREPDESSESIIEPQATLTASSVPF
jgi:hypothetical protein